MQTLPPNFAIEILDALSAHIAVLDGNGTIIAANAAWKRFAGANDREHAGAFIGSNYLAVCDAAALSGDDDARTVAQGLRDVLAGAIAEFSFEYPCHSPKQKRWFVLHVTRVSHAGPAQLIVAHEDITARRNAEDEAVRARQAAEHANRELRRALAREQQNASTDELTGVGNRRHFFAAAARQIARARRHPEALAVGLLDVDRFKRINDTYGHQAGDRVLREVAQRARAQLRSVDELARYGGEEFVMLLPGSDARQAAQVAERIRARCAAEPVMTAQGAIEASVSIGVAEVSAEAGIEPAMRAADRALYRAKDQGRNRVELAVPGDAEAGVALRGDMRGDEFGGHDPMRTPRMRR